jgi:DNA invertase Pin-like site-specific DNA recombinase/RNAse (barnase) inhibitor barstar
MFKRILHIYCRVSSEAQVDGFSLESQKKAGIVRANSLGIPYEIHIEAGKSAKYDHIDNRPVLQKIIDDCDEGLLTDIFVTELDRLTRSPVAMHYLKGVFAENRVIVHTTSQSLNFNDDEQEFMSDVVALLSRRENKLRVKRSIRGMREAALKGKWQGAMLPYGYRRDVEGIIEIDQEEADIYKMMVEMSLKGNGTNTIARHLNELGVETRARKVLKKGTKVVDKYRKNKTRQVLNEEFIWRPGTVYCILTNALYKGERRYKNEVLSIAAIIDTKTWDRLQENLSKNKNYSSNHTKLHFYLLKGLISCSKCDGNFFGRIKTDERLYQCISKRTKFCGTKSINLDQLNDLVFGVVTDHKLQLQLIKEDLQRKGGDENVRKLRTEIEGLKKQLIRIAKQRTLSIGLYETERLTIEEFDSRSAEFVREKNSLENKIAERETELSVLDVQLQELDGLNDDEIYRRVQAWSDDEKRIFLNEKVKRVWITWIPDEKKHYVEIQFVAGHIHSSVAALSPGAKQIQPAKSLIVRPEEFVMMLGKKMWDKYQAECVVTERAR